MKVLVCGGRDFANIQEEVDLMKKTFSGMFDVDDTVTLIHGDSRGADRVSEAILKGFFRGGFEVKRFPANWDKHGKKAGFLRNKQMLEEGKPDLVVAFPGGKGTANMVKLAKDAGVEVLEIK